MCGFHLANDWPSPQVKHFGLQLVEDYIRYTCVKSFFLNVYASIASGSEGALWYILRVLCAHKEDVSVHNIQTMCVYRFRWTKVQVSEQQEFQRTFLEYLSKVRLLVVMAIL